MFTLYERPPAQSPAHDVLVQHANAAYQVRTEQAARHTLAAQAKLASAQDGQTVDQETLEMALCLIHQQRQAGG